MKDDGGGTNENIIEVLMINSTGGPGLLFPKVGSLNYVTGCTLHKACFVFLSTASLLVAVHVVTDKMR